MADLSPAAQAVKDHFLANVPIGLEQGLAAAIRAAADQVVPDEPHPGQSQLWDDEADREWQNNQYLRRKFLRIAAQLDNISATHK
jgi:hypothetical protein